MKRILILFLACCMVFLAGCGKQEAIKEKQYRVGTWKTAQTIQPFMYEKFMPIEFKGEILPFTNPGDQKAALLAGDLNLTGTTLVLAITAASKGEPVVIVSGLCNKCSALVVGKDSNINTPKDLKGKIIAYVPGTMHHILLLEVLKEAGLDPEKDVELKRIDFFDMGQALSQGAVDAFCSGEPLVSLAVDNGYGRILSYPYFGESIGTINAGMLTTREEIEENRELIQSLVTSHAKTTEYLKDHREEWLDTAAEFGTDRKVLELAADNMELAWDMDEDYIQRAKNLAERMKDLGVITQMPDMDALFDLSFVEQARKDLQE